MIREAPPGWEVLGQVGELRDNEDETLLEDDQALRFAPEGKTEPALPWADAWRAWSRETGQPIPDYIGIR